MSISTKKVVYTNLGINAENEDGFFQDREHELKKIEEILNSKQFVHLYGLSGCGKSALASKYALNKFQEDKIVVCWLDASYHSLVNLKLMKLLNELGESSMHSWTITQLDSYKKELKKLDALNSQDTFDFLNDKINKIFFNLQFLFILDDLEDEDFLMNIGMKFKENVKFIFTSKYPYYAFECDALEIKQLSSFKNQKPYKTNDLRAKGFFVDFEEEQIIKSKNPLRKDLPLYLYENDDMFAALDDFDEFILRLLLALERNFVSLEFIEKVCKSMNKNEEEVIDKLIREGILNENHDGYSLSKLAECKYIVKAIDTKKEIKRIFQSNIEGTARKGKFCFHKLIFEKNFNNFIDNQ